MISKNQNIAYLFSRKSNDIYDMKFVKDYNTHLISENLKYHVEKNLSICDSVFYIHSQSFDDVVNEARKLFNNGLIELSDNDKFLVEETLIGEKAEYKGNKVSIHKPFRLTKEQRGKGKKKYGVYHKSGDKVKFVKFGHIDHNVKINSKEDSISYSKRHKCDTAKDKSSAKYWSCNLPKYHKLLNLTEPAYKYW